jgi:hypothetical protein
VRGRLQAMEGVAGADLPYTSVHAGGIAVQVRVAVVTTEERWTLADYEVDGLCNAVRSLQQLARRA